MKTNETHPQSFSGSSSASAPQFDSSLDAVEGGGETGTAVLTGKPAQAKRASSESGATHVTSTVSAPSSAEIAAEAAVIAAAPRSPLRRVLFAFTDWLDAWSPNKAVSAEDAPKLDYFRCLPFLLVHAVCITVIWVGWSPVAVAMAAGLYVVRMFAITAFYHRYFSHRSYRCGRKTQFALALIGNTAVQRGPLWWASHHRNHHTYSDQPEDVHSPVQYGFWRSHISWIMVKGNFHTRLERVGDLKRFPELCWLDRFDTVVPVAFFTGIWGIGQGLAAWAPGLGTNGWQLLIWAFISTVALFHGTFTINSLSHVFGKRRFETSDDSRNNWFLALITLGEGWHNNHHHYPGSVRQGFYWWELDISYLGLRVMEKMGLVSHLRPVPAEVLETQRTSAS